MAIERKPLTGLVRHHRLAHHFLSEGQLAGLRHLDLSLDRAQEALVGGTRFAGNRDRSLAVIERGLDFIEVLVSSCCASSSNEANSARCTSSFTQRL
jgi:hypothetical protein